MTAEEQLVLVEAARRGDAQAFEQLYVYVKPTVRRAVAQIVPQDDIDDAVQDTMLRAFKKIDTFQGDSAFSTWIVSIAKNTALMVVRRQRMEIQHMGHSLDEVFEDPFGVTHKVEPGYEDRTIEQNEARDLIHGALAKVSENERIAVLMQMNGETVEAIAAALDKGIPATKSILLRGRRAIARLILDPKAEPLRNATQPAQPREVAISTAP